MSTFHSPTCLPSGNGGKSWKKDVWSSWRKNTGNKRSLKVTPKFIKSFNGNQKQRGKLPLLHLWQSFNPLRDQKKHILEQTGRGKNHHRLKNAGDCRGRTVGSLEGSFLKKEDHRCELLLLGGCHIASEKMCVYIPAPSKGCQINPKGWWKLTPLKTIWHPLEGPGTCILLYMYICIVSTKGEVHLGKKQNFPKVNQHFEWCFFLDDDKPLLLKKGGS